MLSNQEPMPHFLAILLCIMVLVGLAGLVRLEYKRAQKGPQMSSDAFLHREEELKSGAPQPRTKANQHEIGY